MTNPDCYPEPIRVLINEIENSSKVTSKALIGTLERLNLKAGDFTDFTDFDHSPELSYGRTKLYQGKNFVIFLMSWGLGDFTAIHNHGQSDWGAVTFLGNMDHRLYRNENGNLILVDKSIIPTGSVVPVKGNLVHAMGNLSTETALTLHVYGSHANISAPNSTSNIYEFEKKQVRISTGEAYINGSDNLSEPPGIPGTNEESLIDYFKIILPFYQRNHLAEMESYLKAVIQSPAKYFTSSS